MKKAIRFSIAVCLFSWTMFLIVRYGFGISNTSNKVAFLAFETIYMLFPILTALVLQKNDKQKFNHSGLISFKLSWAWLVAWFLPVLMVFLCIVVNIQLPNVSFSFGVEQLISQFGVPEEQQELTRSQFEMIPPAVLIGSQVVSALIAGATINALFAFGEEYGWRNYLVNALRDVKFGKAVIFIGIVWGIWHFPLILSGHNYPNEPYWGVLLMIVVCILLGTIELYFTLKTKSVIVAAIIHGTTNAISGMVIYFVLGGNDFVNGMTGLAGFITMSIVIAFLWLYDTYISKERIFVKTLGESIDR